MGAISITNEVVDSRAKQKKPHFLYKLDIKKDYDHVIGDTL